MTEATETGARSKPNITPALERAPIRKESLRDDPAEAAAKRAAELRAHLHGNVAQSTDEFDVKHLEPAGWTYEWATWSIYEQRQTTNMMQVEARGWTPVPRSRHPHLMPKDSDLDFILLKGNILMELPTEIVNEYRRAEAQNARNQVRWKEEAIAGTPEGTLPRGEDPRTRPKIGKSFDSAIPEK